MSAEQHNGWEYLESGPRDAEHTVLLLPGTLGTVAFFEELMSEGKLRGSSIRLIATTLPGYGGTSPTEDVSMEGYARQARQLAEDFDCDVVVGHSTGANVALEMALSAGFAGPVVLLSPSLSKEDEPGFPQMMDHLSPVLGSLPWRFALLMIGQAVKADVSRQRHDVLVAEMKKTDPAFLRHQYHLYLEYLRHDPGLAQRLCSSGIKATLAYGEHDDVGLSDGERTQLEKCPHTTLAIIPDAGHLTINEKPDQVAGLILGAVASTSTGRGQAA